MTVDDEIDELYGVEPGDFTARRTELVAAARKRGDVEAARQIAAARRPTAAAWVVNSVVRADATARQRLAQLAEGLRAAHASMDGRRIRELSTSQRALIDELARTGFAAARLSRPSGALRDDVVGTLQAAIADPDVLARLGRLARAERWSGFGDFGGVVVVETASSRPRKAVGAPDPPAKVWPTADEVASAAGRVAVAAGAVELAEKAHVAAVGRVAEGEAKVATARRRYEALLATLDAAERELNAAVAEHAVAEKAARDAADELGTSTSLLAAAEAELGALRGRMP